MSEILSLLEQAFTACVSWASDLLEATDATGVILSCFVIYLVVSLFVVPLRGGRIGGGFVDFVSNKTHKKKGD